MSTSTHIFPTFVYPLGLNGASFVAIVDQEYFLTAFLGFDE